MALHAEEEMQARAPRGLVVAIYYQTAYLVLLKRLFFFSLTETPLGSLGGDIYIFFVSRLLKQILAYLQRNLQEYVHSCYIHTI